MFLILGSPRSGTTWLAKIFDSHPDLLYLHEPDTVVRSKSYLPPYIEDGDLEALQSAARQYCERMVSARTIKTVGSTPIFNKTYRGFGANLSHSLMLMSLKLAAKLSVFGKTISSLNIPDLARSQVPLDKVVVKSVSGHGYAKLLASALRGTKIVIIVRDPRGHVASVLRGIKARRFEGKVQATKDWGIYEDLARTKQAKQYGIDFAAFRAMDDVERLAWRWALTNEKLIQEFSGYPGAKLILYEDLCHAPLKEAHDIFDFFGLGWPDQTEEFLKKSQKPRGGSKLFSQGYYSVWHDPMTAASHWRSELDSEIADRIMAAIGHTQPARLFPDDKSYAVHVPRRAQNDGRPLTVALSGS